MKRKLILILLVLAVVCGSAFAFDPLAYSLPVEGGDFLIDTGIGFAFAPRGGADIKIPPLFASVEYALPVGVPISVGGIVSFYQYEWDHRDWWYDFRYTDTYTFFLFGARGNWHWNINASWLDLYTGLFMGYNYYSYENNYSGSYSRRISEPDYGGFRVGLQAGAHFYFTDHVGAVVEVGYPFPFKAGLALKF